MDASELIVTCKQVDFSLQRFYERRNHHRTISSKERDACIAELRQLQATCNAVANALVRSAAIACHAPSPSPPRSRAESPASTTRKATPSRVTKIAASEAQTQTHREEREAANVRQPTPDQRRKRTPERRRDIQPVRTYQSETESDFEDQRRHYRSHQRSSSNRAEEGVRSRSNSQREYHREQRQRRTPSAERRRGDSPNRSRVSRVEEYPVASTTVEERRFQHVERSRSDGRSERIDDRRQNGAPMAQIEAVPDGRPPPEPRKPPSGSSTPRHGTPSRAPPAHPPNPSSPRQRSTSGGGTTYPSASTPPRSGRILTDGKQDLTTVAKIYGVRVADLRRHNPHLDSYEDYALMPHGTEVVLHPHPNDKPKVVHDTIRSIARSQRVSMEALVAANRSVLGSFGNDEPLPADIELVIPDEDTPRKPGAGPSSSSAVPPPRGREFGKESDRQWNGSTKTDRAEREDRRLSDYDERAEQDLLRYRSESRRQRDTHLARVAEDEERDRRQQRSMINSSVAHSTPGGNRPPGRPRDMRRDDGPRGDYYSDSDIASLDGRGRQQPHHIPREADGSYRLDHGPQPFGNRIPPPRYADPAPSDSQGTEYIKVYPGECLSDVATTFGWCTVEDLRAANPVFRNYPTQRELPPNTTLVVPDGKSGRDATRGVPPPHPANYPPSEWVPINAGTTLLDVSDYFGVSVSTLRALNEESLLGVGPTEKLRVTRLRMPSPGGGDRGSDSRIQTHHF